MNLSKEEKKILIDLICHRQTRMIVKHPEIYESDEYKQLELLKVKIKNEVFVDTHKKDKQNNKVSQ